METEQNAGLQLDFILSNILPGAMRMARSWRAVASAIIHTLIPDYFFQINLINPCGFQVVCQQKLKLTHFKFLFSFSSYWGCKKVSFI